MAKTPLEIKSLARQHTKKAIQVLADIMEQPSAPHAARVMAANALIDRGWGKAIQALEVTTIKQSVIRAPEVSKTPEEWQKAHVPEQFTEH